MNHLLIVDDEILIVNTIRAQYDWEKLNISQVHTAYSVDQAVAVLEKERVDVMICDIELGSRNGLEILEWIQERRLPVVSFVLTGHAEFAYCQRALTLGCVGYVLKPIQHGEMEKVIAMAVEKATQQRRQDSQAQELKRRHGLVNQFWMNVISNTVADNQGAILREAEQLGVELRAGDRFSLVFSHWRPYAEESQFQFRRDEIRYALNNIAQDIFDGLTGVLPAFVGNSNYYIIRHPQGEEACTEPLVRDCQCMNGYAQEWLNTRLFFCVADPQPLERLSAQFRQTYRFFSRQEQMEGGVVVLATSDRQEVFYFKPEVQLWSMLLEVGETEKLLGKIGEYLDACVERQAWNRAALCWFWQDLERVIGGVMKRRGKGGYVIGPQTELEPGQVKARVAEIMEEAGARLNPGGEKRSVADLAKVYIDGNIINGDLSRGTIAAYVGVNPEYLSHAFKRQENITLLDYIVERRVETACALLKNTQLSVSQISARLGYINFSYFSHIFKKKTGQTPAAYRKQTACAE